MAQPIILKLDTKKMNRNWFFEGAKGTYADLVVYENDQEDQYGNSHVVRQSPPKEERDKGMKAVIVGNGKWMPQKGGGGQRGQQQQPPRRPANQEPDGGWGNGTDLTDPPF